MPLSLQDFDYSLPGKLIAQFPAAERTASRLLCLAGRQLADRQFAELPKFLEAGDVLVFNDTRVIKARLFGTKETGGKIEALVERIIGTHEALVQIRASKSPKPGTSLEFGEDAKAEVVERQDDLYLLRFGGEAGVLDLLDKYGHVPLPPYITHTDRPEDLARYQTVYAQNPGAVAAPTAGLHFDEPLLQRLRDKGVKLAWLTLHVGAGTFQPVREENIEAHKMHSEHYEIPQATVTAIDKAHAAHRNVVAVGTTSLRALESAARTGKLGAGEGETDLFITPGYRFNVVDRLITNFHLPKSTLLMLVSAFAGIEPIRAAYEHAMDEKYRFFSYGDAMLIDKQSA